MLDDAMTPLIIFSINENLESDMVLLVLIKKHQAYYELCLDLISKVASFYLIMYCGVGMLLIQESRERYNSFERVKSIFIE